MRHAMRHPRNREIPKSQPSRIPRNCRNRAIAEVQLGSTFAMRQAIWRMMLAFSTAKLYKGSRVACKFVQVVPNRANTMVTYPNQQDFVASLTSSVNGISRVLIASVHRRSRRIACRIAKSFCESHVTLVSACIHLKFSLCCDQSASNIVCLMIAKHYE